MQRLPDRNDRGKSGAETADRFHRQLFAKQASQTRHAEHAVNDHIVEAGLASELGIEM